jgi:hypothetical protein
MMNNSFPLAMLVGAILVRRGCTPTLRGQVTEDVIVEAGGTVTIHGQVAGDLRNMGGSISILGEVVGEVLDE